MIHIRHLIIFPKFLNFLKLMISKVSVEYVSISRMSLYLLSHDMQ